MAETGRARGVCPECGRTISGRAVGIEKAHADRRFVALQPHTRARQGHHRDVVCLARGGRRVVPRIRG
jgi:hypothetical protein